MTDEELKQTAEAMLAWAAAPDGNKPSVDTRRLGTNSPWKRVATPSWDCRRCEYRLTPQPREWWVAVYGDGSTSMLFPSRQKAMDGRQLAVEYVRVREVEVRHSTNGLEVKDG